MDLRFNTRNIFSAAPVELWVKKNKKLIMKTFLFYLILIFLTAGCTKPEVSLIGQYESEGISFLEKPSFFFSGFYGYSMGAELSLHPDFSFEYSTCANLMTGSWKASKDSLFLYVEENRYQIDSLNQVGFQGKFAKTSDQPIKFQIEGDLLVLESINPSGKKLLSKLRKVAD